MIHISRMADHDQVFTLATHDGELLHFAVDRLNDYLEGVRFPVTKLALHPKLISAIARQNGIEPEHLDRLAADRRPWKPLTVVDHENGYHTVVDGSHRALSVYLEGERFAPAWVTPQRLWRRFLIDGYPGSHAEWERIVKNPNFKANPGGKYGK